MASFTNAKQEVRRSKYRDSPSSPRSGNGHLQFGFSDIELKHGAFSSGAFSSGVTSGINTTSGFNKPQHFPDRSDRLSLLPEHDESTSPKFVHSAPVNNIVGLKNIVVDHPFLSSLFIFVPLALIPGQWSVTTFFAFNFMAIIPMAWLIGKATEDLSATTTETAAGLINATFGNIVEMLLCFSSIKNGQYVVTHCTLIGSILSNLLLVMGTAFVVGGYYYKVQRFSQQGASTQCSLLMLSVAGIALPTVYNNVLKDEADHQNMIEISRLVSVLLLFTYIVYLYFQLVSHSHLFEDTDATQLEEEDEPPPDLGPIAATILLCICTFMTSILTDNVIDSIDGTIKTYNVSAEFIGIILLPIIGNAAEHYTAITVAARNKMDLSLAVAAGSSCQVALLVTPACVICGWVMDKEMTLDFHIFQVIVLLSAVGIVSSILGNGTCNWMEGVMLLVLYVIIGLLYYIKGTGPESALADLD